MDFQHSSEIWQDFPQLVPGLMFAEAITHNVSVEGRAARFTAIASSRLAGRTESELPEIRAWRQAFAKMGLKPTQYRSASESLLRRFRKEGTLPHLHPLVDVCNAVSVAFAIPVAVFDVSKITDDLQVRYAAGDEDYLTFSGQAEHPSPHEVIFADRARRVHARRWTNRQSGRSAVQPSTTAALIVAEALHDSAASDVPELITAIAGELDAVWSITPVTAVLSQASPLFTFDINCDDGYAPTAAGLPGSGPKARNSWQKRRYVAHSSQMASVQPGSAASPASSATRSPALRVA